MTVTYQHMFDAIAFARQLYRAELLRDIDDSGLASVILLRTQDNWSDAQVLVWIRMSDEWKGVHASPPPTPPLVPLTVSGTFFKAASLPFFLNECSDFNLYKRYLAGEDITPILRQRAILGFNSLRIFTQYDLQASLIGRLIVTEYPDYYERLMPFLALLAVHKLRATLVAYTGPYTWGHNTAHWSLLGQAVQGVSNVMLSLVNESDQPVNAMDLAPFAPIPNILCSRGSNGSQAIPPHVPGWQWSELHTNDAPEWWRKDHNGMSDVADVFHVPCVVSERTRTDKDGNLAHYEDSGATCVLLCSGGTFHSPEGKTSTLFGASLPFAQAWSRGVKSIPLACQQGAYNHPWSLENQPKLANGSPNPAYMPSKPTYLRVYQRGNCLVWVRP